MTDATRPIIGIENRTPQEVFDIMCDRIEALKQHAPDTLLREALEKVERWTRPDPGDTPEDDARDKRKAHRIALAALKGERP